MYTRKSRLTPRQQSRLIEYFVVGATARAAAKMLGVPPNTAFRFFMRLRQLIASKLPRYDLSNLASLIIEALYKLRNHLSIHLGR